MLGDPIVKWSRNGAYFASSHIPELDDLVDAGAMYVKESVEAWGPCVTYTVTKVLREKMLSMILESNQESRLNER